MNPASVLMYQPNPNWQMILTAYITGIPADAIHATATVLFLWLFSEPMLEKLDRVKVKYGLVEK
jgi:energy-coupling factor transport system ATP-binding protein